MKSARIAVPDLVSNSYFPAIAAIALGLFAKEGLDAQHRLIFPNTKAFEALRDGEVDFVAGPAHVVLRAFTEWQGVKLLAALAQGMYWLLVMRSDLDAKLGDVNAVRGRTIAAAPLVEMPLRHMLSESGIDLARDDVRIVETPGAHEPGVSSGVRAAKALEAGQIDGVSANAMGAQNAITSGVGKVVLDVRRGLGPKAAFHYTMPVLVTSDRAIERDFRDGRSRRACGGRGAAGAEERCQPCHRGRAKAFSRGRGRIDRRRGGARSSLLHSDDNR